MTENKITTRELTFMGLMTAIMCALGPLSIPLPGLVPISLGTLVIYFYPYLLGTRRAALCCLIYILLGTVGLPVFSGYSGGLPKLLGPTGGYMLGYFFIILFEGLAIKRFPNNRLIHASGIILGTVCCYLIGTLWLSHLLGLTFTKGLAAGVIPFIPGDIGKATAALLIAPVLRTRLQTAGLTLH
ncbi:biotin transporter BioY [Oscillospiraceae bacterium LTW-04]|nr:biotin transporter BioY [Oscillospiraceae bacterium MB24-C1]